MGRALFLCLSLFALSGCATLSYPLPKCDGYARRPLNRSLWDWEASERQENRQQSSLGKDSTNALAFREHPAEPAVKTAAFSRFDVAASYKACGAG